ncbi:MAG: hypothetical protein AB8H86_11750 [Polyangiales bacterium]
METRFPWHWKEGRTERLVASACILCAALAAPAFVSAILHDQSTYNTAKDGVPLVLSTALWAWCFHRFLWKRSLSHAFWLGPLLGALNAGTTFGLSSFVAGQGAGSAVGGLLVGSVFGTFIGGGPLGIGFAAVLASYIKAVRYRIATGATAASLHVLRASAWLFAFGGGCCTYLQLRPQADLSWPTSALLVVGLVIALIALVAHLHAILWTRSVRAGSKRAHIRRDEFDAELVVLEVRGAEEGAFRTPEHERVLGYLPQHLGFGAAQCTAATAALITALVVLNTLA